MSYCRFARDSEIYLFEHCDGFIECCMCSLATGSFSAELHTRSAAIEHVKAHIQAGDKVPEDVIPSLQERIREEGDEVKPYGSTSSNPAA